MKWKKEWKKLALILAAFSLCFYLPVELLRESSRFRNAAWEALHLVRWYAREHVLLCLIPAFFIAGAIAVFVSQASVIKYLGAGANKVLAYGVASVSGTILAVCSCTVLPLFAGIYRMGAGIGPATAFLYSGPAINVLAIILTARVLGLEMGVARAVGAVVFSVLIGLLMHLFFRKEEAARTGAQAGVPQAPVARPLWQNALFFLAMVGVLVFANWGRPADPESGSLFAALYRGRFWVAGAFLLAVAAMAVFWFRRAELGEWGASSWGFAKQILPLLLVGVLAAGLLLGRVGREGLIPSEWVAAAVGGNSLAANFFAALAGAFMYFATLTEVPILQGLMSSGMGKGPALALLLAGPALSLPNMLVIRSVMGTRKTLVFVALVVVMATASGILYGWLFG